MASMRPSTDGTMIRLRESITSKYLASSGDLWTILPAASKQMLDENDPPRQSPRTDLARCHRWRGTTPATRPISFCVLFGNPHRASTEATPAVWTFPAVNRAYDVTPLPGLHHKRLTRPACRTKMRKCFEECSGTLRRLSSKWQPRSTARASCGPLIHAGSQLSATARARATQIAFLLSGHRLDPARNVSSSSPAPGFA